MSDTKTTYTVSASAGASIRIRADSMAHAAAMLGAHHLGASAESVSVEQTGQNGDFYSYRVSDGQRVEEIHVSL